MAAFNVNMDEVVGLSAKLDRMHRSDFPIAVRQTLNDAAFKTKAMVPKVAGQKFTIRQKSFFRAFSTVHKAVGFDVKGMKAVAGIDATKGNQVAAGLEQQEQGGSVVSRKLIPHDMGRISGSPAKKLRSKYRFRNINIATKKDRKPGSKYILIKKGNKGTVFEIRRLKTRTKLKPIYVYRPSRTSRVARSPFMEPSAMFAAKKMPEYYRRAAERRFLRALQ